MIKPFLPIEKILTDITTSDQSGPGNNDKEGLFYIPQSSRTKASLSDGFVSYLET